MPSHAICASTMAEPQPGCPKSLTSPTSRSLPFRGPKDPLCRKEQPTLGRSCPGRSALLRQLVVDALHIEVHAEDLLVGKGAVAPALHLRAVLFQDRALEGVELAGPNGGLGLLGHLLHI